MTEQQTKYQTEVRTIHRRDIKNAPYNPRKISDKAFKALKKNLSKRGLMSTLTWNERSGNLVSGHQRLFAIDQLEGTEDYSLTVSVCNLSEKEEMEQNIFFNSTTVQGEFDFDLLADILPDIDFMAAGLSEQDMAIIGISVFEDEVTTDEQKEDRAALKEKVKSAKKQAADRITDRFEEGETYVVLSFQSFDAKKTFCRKYGYDAQSQFIAGEEFEKKVND